MLQLDMPYVVIFKVTTYVHHLAWFFLQFKVFLLVFNTQQIGVYEWIDVNHVDGTFNALVLPKMY